MYPIPSFPTQIPYDISMIVGNKQAQEVLATYIHSMQTQERVPFPFLLLSGPEHVGKTTVAEELIAPLLGENMLTDYLPIYDLSALLEKNHTFKVEVGPKDQLIEIEGKRYVDKWARDIVQRLALAPVGKFKVVFLENIERMNSASANAFLKTLEEPLPNRLIIATTSHKELLLDTILSRAFTIWFQLPSLHEVTALLTKEYPTIGTDKRAFVASFSLGRIWYAKQLLENTEQLDDQAPAFLRLLKLLQIEGSIVEQYKLLQQFAQWGPIEHLIDAVLYTFEGRQLSYADRWLQARSLLRTNVGEDNVLFNLALP